MADVQIGKSQVYASTLGLGTNKIGGHNLFKNLDDKVGKEVLRTALRNGVTLLDTAYAYGFGQSEKLIGEVLQEAEFDRARVIIATKAAQVPGNEEQLDNSPEFLQNAVEDALKRLQTEYIDIFYIHFPDEATKKNEAVKALHELKEAGKIRAIGVSNFSLAQIKEANLDGYVDVVEDNYNLLHREAETELFPYLAKHNISFIPYFPLASGLLSGKYTADQKFAENDSRSKNPNFTGERYQKIIATMEEMKIIAHRNDATVTQLVLAWYLKNPNIAAVIPGARNVEQMMANAKATDIRINNDDYELIDDLFRF
ncbi:myo-inositol catabolism protein IolS [Enterococcus sp. DIV0755b]|uniref:aldo/keto reductase n=1 Tax=Enterococcus sp. DIV0755b TaxID=2774657 RepID=UPI003F2775AF